jgi:transposase InsO family protein
LVPSPSGGLITLLETPRSTREHCYIIIAVDYFTKWVEAMPTFRDDGEIAALFLFNSIIARFGIPREIVTDHGSHFQNQMMTELTSNLGLQQENSSPYYPQANGQVEAINKTLKTILQNQLSQVKLAFDVILNIMDLMNIC